MTKKVVLIAIVTGRLEWFGHVKRRPEDRSTDAKIKMQRKCHRGSLSLRWKDTDRLEDQGGTSQWRTDGKVPARAASPRRQSYLPAKIKRDGETKGNF